MGLTPTWEDYQKVLRKGIMDKIGRTYFNSCIVINFEDIGYGKDIQFKNDISLPTTSDSSGTNI